MSNSKSYKSVERKAEDGICGLEKEHKKQQGCLAYSLATNNDRQLNC